MENIEKEKIEAGKELKEQVYPFNLLTNYEMTLAAMAEVEGGFWLRDDQKGIQKELSTRGAIEYFEKLKKSGAHPEDTDVIYTIYGNGGVSRWKLMGNGEVWFSEFHHQDKAKKAEERGFKIFR